jgi:hypothetical protein
VWRENSSAKIKVKRLRFPKECGQGKRPLFERVASQIRLGDYFSVSRNPSNSLLYDASGYAVLKQPAPATGWYFDPYYIQFGRDSVAKSGSSGIH